MNIVIILGSIREGRQSHKVAYHLAQRVAQHLNVEVEMIDLADRNIPQLNNRWAQQEEPAPDLPELSQILHDADGILLVSPEYHGSYTGVLKNTIDHYWKEFQRKPMGVVTTGSGKFGGINASHQMQQLILSLGAYPIPQKLLVPFAKTSFTDAFEPSDEGMAAQVEKFLAEFLWFTQAIKKAREAEALVGNSIIT